jgi:parvulin-like peptidyl-prolyl isomerase
MKKTMILSLCLVALLVTGCGQVAKLKDGTEVVAEVNGKKITADDLYGEMKTTYARNVLIDMIDKTVLEKVYKTDDDMKTTINNQIDSYKQQLGDNFMSTVKSQLGLNTEEEFFNYLLLNYKRNLAAKDYIKTIITDAEIQTYYNTKTVGDIRASHILIKPDTTDSMTADEKAAKETEAEDLAKDIIKKLNNGEDFATLAKKYSDDGSASKGGDLGWFNKGAMVESFETAAYALKKGEYTKTPVKSDYGYHIILKTDQKTKPSLKDAKNDIISSITTDKLAETNNTYTYQALIELRKKYKLNIQDSELKKQYDSYMNELLNQ